MAAPSTSTSTSTSASVPLSRVLRPARDAEIRRLVGQILQLESVWTSDENAPPGGRDITTIWAEFHQRWWIVVNEDPAAEKDWPAFVTSRHYFSEQFLDVLLTAIYGEDIRRARRNTDLYNRLKIAARHLGFQDQLKLAFLYLGRAVCGSSASLRKISALVSSRSQATFPVPAVLAALRQRMLWRHHEAELAGVPELSIEDVKAVEQELRPSHPSPSPAPTPAPEPVPSRATNTANTTNTTNKRPRETDDETDAEQPRAAPSLRLSAAFNDTVLGGFDDLPSFVLGGSDESSTSSRSIMPANPAAIWGGFVEAAKDIVAMEGLGDGGGTEAVMIRNIKAAAEALLAIEGVKQRLGAIEPYVENDGGADKGKGRAD